MAEQATWLYKFGQEAQIFKGEAIQIAIDTGWVDSPAKVEDDIIEMEVEVTAIEDKNIDDLKAKADELGIKYRSDTKYETLLKKIEAV